MSGNEHRLRAVAAGETGQLISVTAQRRYVGPASDNDWRGKKWSARRRRIGGESHVHVTGAPARFNARMGPVVPVFVARRASAVGHYATCAGADCAVNMAGHQLD